MNAEKSGWATMAAISGVRTLVTKDVTTAPKAAPITTATARSITLPRRMNSRNPLNIASPPPQPACWDTRMDTANGNRPYASSRHADGRRAGDPTGPGPAAQDAIARGLDATCLIAPLRVDLMPNECRS